MHACIHTCMHAYIHTYIHTYIHRNPPAQVATTEHTLCCACNIHVTGYSMYVVTLHAMLHAQFSYMHVGYMSHTHVPLM